MYKSLSLSVIIPSLNEERGIGAVLKSIPEYVDQIIVVDGGSIDQTENIVSQYKKVRLIIERRRGYGLAYKVGFKHAQGDIIVTADADGTYPLSALPSLLDELIEKNLDFISSSRFPLRHIESMKFINFFGNVIITMLLDILFHQKITDGLSGMWLFRRSCLDKITLTSDTWNLSPEIKIEAATHPSLRFAEYPIVYAERMGETKLLPWRVGLENILFLFRKRLRRRRRP